MLSLEEAILLVKNSSKFTHMPTVSRMMSALARALGENELEWKLTGLLHDLDYDEVTGNMSMHGMIASEKLKGKLPKECLGAIRTHDHRTGLVPKSRLDKAVIAADSLANLVQTKGKVAGRLRTVEFRSELVAISADRPWLADNIVRCREIGLELSRFLQLCFDAIEDEKMAR